MGRDARMENEGLLERAVANILDHHLMAPAGRRVVIVCDKAKWPLAEALARGLDERGRKPALLRLEARAEGGRALLDDLFAEAGVGLIVLASPRMWRELELATRLVVTAGGPTLRVACAPIFLDMVMPLESVLRVYGSDYADNVAYAASLRAQLVGDASYRLTAAGGTDLTFRARDWQAGAQEICELHTSPVEDSVQGRIVADGSVFFARITAPIALEIRAGRLVATHCADERDATYRAYVKEMRKRMAADAANGQLAEVGLGVNAGARLSGCIMEDEAVRGTCHFCFGDNARYGGRNTSDWHGGTVVVRAPRLERLA